MIAVQNLSKSAFKFKEQWNKSDPINRLLHLLEKYKQVNRSYQGTIYFTLANICSEEDFVKYSNDMDGSSVNGPIINAFKYIVTRIEPLANLLESNKDIKRISITL